jgi:hypothetical protein
MTDQLTVLDPLAKLATVSVTGQVRIYEVALDGQLVDMTRCMLPDA